MSFGGRFNESWSTILLTAHIFFDDSMTLNDDEEVVVNKFVQTFVSKIDEAAR